MSITSAMKTTLPPLLSGRFQRCLAALALAALPSVMNGPVRVSQAAQQQQVFPVPPECTTRSKLSNSPIDRAWVFIMNFRVSGTACVLVYDRTRLVDVEGDMTNPLIGYQSLPDACGKTGNVAMAYGRGFFYGGYISCTVNIMSTVNTILSNTGQLTETATPEDFYIMGRGWISPTMSQPGQPGLILGYVPDNTNFPAASLSVAVTQTNPTRAQIFAQFNGNIYSSARCGFSLDNAPQQLWAFTRDRGELKFWLINNPACDPIGPRQRVLLRQDGGTIYIGGAPTGFRFLGILDEVLLDPAGGGRPPNSFDDDNPEASFIFVPLTMR